jgi:hypothetical protein
VQNPGTRYDDGRVACDDEGLTLRWYYLWGAKRIPYGAITSVRRVPLRPWGGRWRIWGSGDLHHWYNLDRTRPNKRVALELHTGARSVPVITPDDPDAVERILAQHAQP